MKMAITQLLQSVLANICVGNVLTAVAGCLIVVWFIRHKYWGPTNLPPGPPSIPFPLSLFLTRKNRMRELVSITDKYGDIACMQTIDNATAVVIGSLELVKELIVKQADVTSDRKVPNVFKHILKYNEGIIFNSGENWQAIRRFSLFALRNFGMGKKSLQFRISEEAHMLREAMWENQGESIDPANIVNNAVSNVICSITFGHRFEYTDPTFKDIITRVRLLISGRGSIITRVLLTRYPFIMNIPLFHKQRENLLSLKHFINREVQEHADSFDEDDMRDIVDMYLAEVRRLETSGEKMYLNKKDIWMCVLDLFLAGTETTSSTLLWFFLVMAGMPHIQKEVVKEIDAVIGRQKVPTYEDRKNMPYMEATLTETLRFRPLAPFGVPHVASKDINIRGYTIPKDTSIMMNILAIHHDPKIWSNPEVFDPSRFLSDDGKTFVKNDAVIPFGAGRRICLGEQLAKMELFIFTTNILQRFMITLPDGASPDYSIGHRIITLTPKPYRLCFKQR